MIDSFHKHVLPAYIAHICYTVEIQRWKCQGFCIWNHSLLEKINASLQNSTATALWVGYTKHHGMKVWKFFSPCFWNQNKSMWFVNLPMGARESIVDLATYLKRMYGVLPKEEDSRSPIKWSENSCQTCLVFSSQCPVASDYHSVTHHRLTWPKFADWRGRQCDTKERSIAFFDQTKPRTSKV